jgi:hypothetical protein
MRANRPDYSIYRSIITIQIKAVDRVYGPRRSVFRGVRSSSSRRCPIIFSSSLTCRPQHVAAKAHRRSRQQHSSLSAPSRPNELYLSQRRGVPADPFIPSSHRDPSSRPAATGGGGADAGNGKELKEGGAKRITAQFIVVVHT